MSTPYTVKEGDWLSKIAAAHGLASWQDLYYHPDNAAFRAKRPNPDLIYPGDVVMIPNGDAPPGPGPGPGPGPKPTPKKKSVVATADDTFCGIAVREGFPNCARLRAEPANAAIAGRQLQKGDVVTIPELEEGQEAGATEQLHEFQRDGLPPATVRFVHGTPNLAFEDDPTLRELNVSNYRPDRAGANRTANFVNDAHRTFDADAHADVDTFKLEVHDLHAKANTVNVEMEMRRPVYDAAGKLTGHTDFPGTHGDAATERGRRGLDAVAEKMGGTQRFRTCYLRLSVDAEDKAVRPTQSLLASHMIDAAPADEAVEILDQAVVGSYRIEGCPAAPDDAKCRAKAEIQLCDQAKQRRVKARVHVLRTSRTGAGVITVDTARKECLRNVRELYAQAHMSLKLVSPPRLVPPPSNLFALADGNGRNSLGGSKIKVRVRVDAGIDKEVEIDTDAGRPIVNANKLAAAIRTAVGPTVRVTASENPAVTGQAIGSADVLVGHPVTQDVRLNVITDGDARHPISVGRTATAQLASEFGGNDSHVGTIHERVLVKNFDTGSDRIDLIVVSSFPPGSGTLGEAFTPNNHQPAAQRPIATMINSAIVLQRPFANRNTFHTTVPHEMGHILMDANHSTEATSTELMTNGSPVGTNERNPNGPKRISDPDAATNNVPFDDGQRGNPVTFIRTKNPTLLEAW